MKTFRTIMMIILIFALITIFTTTAAAVHCNYSDICVNETSWWRDGGTLNTSTTPIQAAVNNAVNGETIFVYNGSYSENIYIKTTSLTLTGEGANVVTVTAASNQSHVFKVISNYVNISGFTTTGATKNGKAGIHLNTADQCNIHNNTASNNSNGIFLLLSSTNTLANNNASSNSDYGIHLTSSSSNTLVNNIANSNYNGIYISFSSTNTIMSNTASSNYWRGVYLSTSSNSNTLTNNIICSNNDCGIFLYQKSNNLIYNNYFNNTNNTKDEGVNTWNTTITTGPNIIGGPSIGGNYWSDYTGDDTNGDGFGEIPYDIGINKDHLPLVRVTCVGGDVDENGIINILDVRLLMNHVIDPDGYPVTPGAGDLDGDEDIDEVDVGMLLNLVFNPIKYPLTTNQGEQNPPFGRIFLSTSSYT